MYFTCTLLLAKLLENKAMYMYVSLRFEFRVVMSVTISA